MSQVMWSLVLGSVTEAMSTTTSPLPGAGRGWSTTAAAASPNSACDTICSGSLVGGWMCKEVSSTHTSTAGRCWAITKAAALSSAGSAA